MPRDFTDWTDTDPDGWDDRTMTVGEVWRYLVRILPWCALATIVVHSVAWGWPGYADQLIVGGPWIGIGIYLLSVVIHEGLHVATMVAFGVPLRSIRAGAHLREGVVYVHAGHDLAVVPYRVVLLMPALVLGVLPSMYGLLTGDWGWTLYGFVMLISAAGDFAVIDRLRGLPTGTLVRDHPEKVGCKVRLPETGAI